MKHKISSFVIAMLLSFSVSTSRADGVRDFLMTCTYGTLAGALLGAASLAFVEDPSVKLSNVAKGASLGLYVGIGIGAAKMYSASSPAPEVPLPEEDVQNKLKNPVLYFQPIYAQHRKLDGASVNLALFSW